jgi:hypothetical protein
VVTTLVRAGTSQAGTRLTSALPCLATGFDLLSGWSGAPPWPGKRAARASYRPRLLGDQGHGRVGSRTVVVSPRRGWRCWVRRRPLPAAPSAWVVTTLVRAGTSQAGQGPQVPCPGCGVPAEPAWEDHPAQSRGQPGPPTAHTGWVAAGVVGSRVGWRWRFHLEGGGGAGCVSAEGLPADPSGWGGHHAGQGRSLTGRNKAHKSLPWLATGCQQPQEVDHPGQARERAARASAGSVACA